MIWSHLIHLNKNENWGDADKMNGILLLTTDTIRNVYDSPFIIHCGYELEGHTKGSQHGLGNAIDFHIKDDNALTFQCYQLSEIFRMLQIEKAGRLCTAPRASVYSYQIYRQNSLEKMCGSFALIRGALLFQCGAF